MNWKVINSGSSNPSLNKIFSSMREKWNKKITNEFGEKPKHFTIAGGNYTYFFLLSKSLKMIRDKYPFLPVELKLMELRQGSKELFDKGAFDLLLSGEYVGSGMGFLDEIKKTEYRADRKSYSDEAYFCASKESVEKFGSVEATLKNHDILFGRMFSDNKRDKEISYFCDTNPKGRKMDSPRVITDQMLLSYLLMEKSAGIWFSFKSMPKTNNVEILSKSVQNLKRFFIHKKNETQISKDIRKNILRNIKQRSE